MNPIMMFKNTLNNMNSNPVGQGNIVPLHTLHKKHFGENIDEASSVNNQSNNFLGKFSDAIKNAVNDTNRLQINSSELSQKMLYEPDSINIADVVIAAEKAQLSLNLTKGIVDRAVQAYQNITNLR